MAFAIALHLNLEETTDLIGRAGYTLSRSSKSDLIVEYFIKNRIKILKGCLAGNLFGFIVRYTEVITKHIQHVQD